MRTYYSIEKPKLPFQLSLAGIILNVFFDWFLLGAPTYNFGNLFPYNFGVIGIILSSVMVNLIICFFLSRSLDKYKINLPRTILLKKFILISLACFISSTLCYSFIKNIAEQNSNNLNFIMTIIGVLIFSIIYFYITKLFGVNKYKILLKK